MKTCLGQTVPRLVYTVIIFRRSKFIFPLTISTKILFFHVKWHPNNVPHIEHLWPISMICPSLKLINKVLKMTYLHHFWSDFL